MYTIIFSEENLCFIKKRKKKVNHNIRTKTFNDYQLNLCFIDFFYGVHYEYLFSSVLHHHSHFIFLYLRFKFKYWLTKDKMVNTTFKANLTLYLSKKETPQQNYWKAIINFVTVPYFFKLFSFLRFQKLKFEIKLLSNKKN